MSDESKDEHYYNGWSKELMDQFLLPSVKEALWLTKEEIRLLSDHLKNEYLPNHDPIRSLLLKIHQFADSK